LSNGRISFSKFAALQGKADASIKLKAKG